MPDPALVSWTRTISSYIQRGKAELALREFRRMCKSGMRPNEHSLSLALKASRLAGERAIGKLLHGCSIKFGLESNPFCSASVVDLYCKFSMLNEARRFFDNVSFKCEALWNSLIDGYARFSISREPVGLFHQMLLSSTSPNCFTYTILIKFGAQNSAVDLLNFFHGRVVMAGFESDNFVAGALLDAYAKLGQLTSACRLFWGTEERDLVMWSTLLTRLHQGGELEQAFDLFLRFVSEGYKLDSFMFATLFRLCSDLGSQRIGLQLHSCLLKSGFVIDSFIGSALVAMYTNFGLIHDAYGSFLSTEEKNEVIFSEMVHGFIYSLDIPNAVAMIHGMKNLGIVLDHSTLACILRAFASFSMFGEATAIHCFTIKSIGEQDLVIGNSLIEMYSNFREVDQAVKVFMAMREHNEFSWTSLMSGFIESERSEEALQLYHSMQSLGSTKPTEYTFVAILKACSTLPGTTNGRKTHGYVIKMGFNFFPYVESALITMYSKKGCLDEASQVFAKMPMKDPVSWSAIIAAYVQQGYGEKALKIFSEYNYEASDLEESIFSSSLCACSSLGLTEMGRSFHGSCVKTGNESNLQVNGAIIDMYCKCGSIEDAIKVFVDTNEHNVISYTAMISGYAQNGLGFHALQLFDVMLERGFKPDGVTFVGVLSACSHFGLVEEGWKYFISITDYGLERTMNHYACMVDLLGRAGFVDKAEDLIDDSPFSSKAMLWKTLLGACGKHENSSNAGRIAEMLVRVEPNDPSNYVMLSNIYSSNSLWARSLEVMKKMEKGLMKKVPGCSWV
ncbi:Pentatricopeptide repeat-containing protein [Apostasia shenzhenica]|uniref:Pentatricopeptide repeat-containing protein n=1 Tax=Apostasia shenzhenica TaxID=1088818 RepID=A0A2I0A7W9_9ASPA|nr:Pentatricopeptide repeat-containing protein [Apostasia shenzhenica]